jgi:hypothetical protein
MKTGYLVVVVLLSVCMSAMGQTSTAPAVGDGSIGSPYQIATLNNLYWIASNSANWTQYYIQTADIDASATSGWFSDGSGGYYGWPPIGDSNPNYFTGTYDGQGFKVTNVYIHRPSTDYVGLFGVAYIGAAISNLGVTGVNITGKTQVGGLVGAILKATLSNCYSTGSVTGNGNYIGGLVGYSGAASPNGSTISYCYSTCSVTSNASAIEFGGLVGYNLSGTISNCYSTGSVGGLGSVFGGLAGGNAGTGATIDKSYSTGGVSGTSPGGLVSSNPATVTNSFWDTQTSGQASSGGGTGKTTADMKTQSTFTGAGWSTSVWNMGDGINNGYPYLKWQNPSGTPLPVELVSISASVVGSEVVLRWQTATEVNNYGFEIERGSIGMKQSTVEWQKVGFEEGAGTSSSPREYTYSDRRIPAGRYAYRIKQIDKDGSFKYAGEVEVEVGVAPKEFNLVQNYPNPFNPSTTIEFSVPVDGLATLKVFDMLGREVATLFNGESKAGYYNRVVLDASRLASGLYFSRLEFGGKQILKKMVLMK